MLFIVLDVDLMLPISSLCTCNRPTYTIQNYSKDNVIAFSPSSMC